MELKLVIGVFVVIALAFAVSPSMTGNAITKSIPGHISPHIQDLAHDFMGCDRCVMPKGRCADIAQGLLDEVNNMDTEKFECITTNYVKTCAFADRMRTLGTITFEKNEDGSIITSLFFKRFVWGATSIVHDVSASMRVSGVVENGAFVVKSGSVDEPIKCTF